MALNAAAFFLSQWWNCFLCALLLQTVQANSKRLLKLTTLVVMTSTLQCPVCVGCSSDRSRKGVKAVKTEWVLAVLEVIYRNCHWAVRASEQFVVTISTAPCLCSCSTFLRLGQALVSSKVRIRMPWLTVLIIFSVDRTGRHFGCCKLCCGHKPAAHLMVMPLSIFVHAVLWREQDK